MCLCTKCALLWVVGCWRGCLERGADLHMAQLMPLPLTVSCYSRIQIGFTFLVPAHPGSPGQRAIERVCVCVCVCVLSEHCYVVARVWQLVTNSVKTRRHSSLTDRYSSPHCHVQQEDNYIYFTCILSLMFCLQCFDAVGWVAGRASGL